VDEITTKERRRSHSPMKRMIWIIFLLILAGGSFSDAPLISSSRAEAEPNPIRVGVGIGLSQTTISAKSPIILKDGNGKKFRANNNITIGYASKNTVKIGKHSLKLPLELSSKGFLKFNKVEYRGIIRILSNGNSFNVVNVLDVEDYLRGVLKMETNPAWHLEALKAQAVISRTYALKNRGKYGSKGFDLTATPNCQVYRGVNAETSRTDQAIKETKGVVVVYGSDLALTPFHSDSGGATANVAEVWSSSIPYLRGVKEAASYDSPYSSWNLTLSSQQIQEADVIDLQVNQRDAFGRPVTLIAKGSHGTKEIKTHQFRMAVGPTQLRSTFFTINGETGSSTIQGPQRNTSTGSQPTSLKKEDLGDINGPMTWEEEQSLITLTQQGAFSANEMIDMLMHPEKKKTYLLQVLKKGTQQKAAGAPSKVSAQSSSRRPSKGTFVFSGKGWGHGVGLSQWGAKSLAEQGWKYAKILQHYYPGTNLKQR
jgi:stage II sporulation protein D